MKKIISLIDGISIAVGKTTAWLTLAMVLLTTYLVVMRYVFNSTSIALQELVLYMHASVFMLGAAYALQSDQHVRVDVLYRGLSSRKKAVLDIIGTLCFLLPFTALVAYYGYNYAASAWKYREASTQPGGLPYVYLLKTLLPAFAVMMFLQGIAELLRNILIFMGKWHKAEEK